MSAVKTAGTTRQLFMLSFEFWSVAVISFSVAILETSVTYIMTSFFVYLLEQAKKPGLR